MVLPCVLLLAVFAYRPVLRSIELSLFGSDLLGRPTRFVGLDHYVTLLTDPDLRRTLLVTLTVTVLSTALATGGALAAALPLRRASRRGGAVVSLLLSLPFAYSAAAASAVFAGLFAPAVGTINTLFGGGPPWLQAPGWAMVSIALATAWYEFGFAFLVLLAALSALDDSVLEAAALDGAGEWRLACAIVVPTIRPSLLFLVVTQTISGLQIFTQVQVLTRGGPSGSTSTLVFELYQRAFGDGLPDYGTASAIALALLVLVVAVTALQFRLARGGS